MLRSLLSVHFTTRARLRYEYYKLRIKTGMSIINLRDESSYESVFNRGVKAAKGVTDNNDSSSDDLNSYHLRLDDSYASRRGRRHPR